jgi:hypothetical protein
MNPVPARADEASAKRKPPEVLLTQTDDKAATLDISGDFERLQAAVDNPNVLRGMLLQIARLGAPGEKVSQPDANFALGYVDSMRPKDSTEALLLAQMTAIHLAMMTLARRLNDVENLPQQDSAERALNKLARTFAMQVDTLKRYRSKGEQVVRVERMTVESGAQAMVGNIQRGEG